MGIRSASSSPADGSHHPALSAGLGKRAPQDAVRTSALCQHDDRPPEAAAGHPGAEGSGCQSCFDDSIQRGRRNLVVVSEAGVAGGEQRAKGGEVLTIQRVQRLANALVFGRDVTNAPRVACL